MTLTAMKAWWLVILGVPFLGYVLPGPPRRKCCRKLQQSRLCRRRHCRTG